MTLVLGDNMDSCDCETTDKSTAVLLISAGLPIIKTYVNEHGKTVFVFNKEEAKTWLEKDMRHEKIMFDFYVVMRAINLFNSVVHSTR